ncbi:Histidine-containing phosphotransfer protein 1 isoform 1 [Hibiscus syriacus]|uniref:Histidine-containing phosphotransfer protein 1 isoform 1 n=1 Tax=Hibiscus syriacus TaxID=106335 RepID=A0A6A3BM17_HIBSY|nr:Histidine-containing phosphotransfer protein 1 isoform 1 [Hibiscus syriacus]
MAVSRSYTLRFMILFSFLYLSCDSFLTSPSSIINPSKVKQVSWKPRSSIYLQFAANFSKKFHFLSFVYESFLTDLECDHLISLAKSELKRSAVADNVSGKSKLSEVRTSSGMFIAKTKDPIVDGIEEKISTWTFLPKGYEDFLHTITTRLRNFETYLQLVKGWTPLATVLMYLTNVTKGDETVFPKAEESPLHTTPAKDDLSDCKEGNCSETKKRGCPSLLQSLP